MAKIDDLLQDYLDYLTVEKGRSPKTRRNYEHYLREFFKDAGIKSEGDMTERAIKAFRVRLSERATGRRAGMGDGKMKKVTQNYYVIAIRSFLKYLAKHDYKVIAADKIELPKIAQRQIEIPEYRDFERLINAPEGEGLRALRDRAILETLFSTGLRVSELCNLSRYLDLSRGEVTVRGKGEKLRVVFFSDGCKATIKKYLDKRGDALEWMFVSLTKVPKASEKPPKAIGKITPRAVQRLVNFYTRKAGLAEKVTPHKLRHLFATDLLVNGADLRSVQELLGHSNISTTQIYTHLTNKQLGDVHKKFHGKRR